MVRITQMIENRGYGVPDDAEHHAKAYPRQIFESCLVLGLPVNAKVRANAQYDARNEEEKAGKSRFARNLGIGVVSRPPVGPLPFALLFACVLNDELAGADSDNGILKSDPHAVPKKTLPL